MIFQCVSGMDNGYIVYLVLDTFISHPHKRKLDTDNRGYVLLETGELSHIYLWSDWGQVKL